MFDAATIERYRGYFIALLEELVSARGQAGNRMELLPAAEKHRLLVEWNDTQREYPSETCVHVLFEEQVEKTPEAPAVVFEGELSATASSMHARTGLRMTSSRGA